MRIHLTSVYVDDQDKALDFYTRILGFVVPPFKEALVQDGIPFTSFAVGNVHQEHARLSATGVQFT